MIYVAAVFAGITAAVIGWFVTGAFAAWIAGLYGMSDFEGARATFAFLGVAPIGGLVSMVASAWVVLQVGQGRAPIGRTLARLAAVLGGIVLVVAAGIAVRFATLDTYANTAPPALEFEIRVPAAIVHDVSATRVELHTDKNVGESQLGERWVSAENDRMVIAGSVPLAFKTSSRLLVVSLSNQPTRLFRVLLSRDPRSTPTLSAWQRPDHLHAAGAEQPHAAAADDPVEIRYRVRRAGED